MKKKLVVLFALVLLAFVGLGVRLILITKNNGEEYQTYVERISEDSVATEVKIADLCENMDITRLKKLTDKDCERLKKYHRAYTFLTTKNCML